MTKNKRLLLFLVSVILVIAIIVGCAPTEKRDETPTKDTTPKDTTPEDTTKDRDTTKEEKPDTTTKDTRSEDAKKIADKVEDLEEVDSATCLITDDTAMIGVQFSEQYKGELTDEIKEKVEDVAKETDKDITKVVVTADPDLYKRIETIVKDIAGGKPLTGFKDEIDEILNRIQPK